MKILVIEDEPLVARDLINHLSALEPTAEVFGPLSSVKACEAWFSDNPPPDLVLSDIQLSDGISFEVFESLSIKCPVIFTTAYDAFAIRAFKLNSIDYLLQPIDRIELSSALSKYKSLISGPGLQEQLREALKQIGGVPKEYKERFLAIHRNALVPVRTSEIAYFRKEELIYLHTTAGERLISEHATLDEIESLVDPAQFFRVNRQHILHIQAVGRIKSTSRGLAVQLRNEPATELDVSREKAATFRAWVGA